MADYCLNDPLVKAIRSSGKTQIALGATCGLAHSTISQLLAGRRFGDAIRAKVVVLGAALGVDPADCTRPAHTPMEGESVEAFDSRFAIVFYRELGFARVVDEIDGVQLSYQDFARAFGDAAAAWLASGPARTFASIGLYHAHRTTAEGGAR